jgi:hypothetical protein
MLFYRENFKAFMFEKQLIPNLTRVKYKIFKIYFAVHFEF